MHIMTWKADDTAPKTGPVTVVERFQKGKIASKRAQTELARSLPSGSKLSKAAKPSREERGYTAPHGKKYTKDDWKQFFQPQDGKDLVGDEPDFSEEGWARRFPKK